MFSAGGTRRFLVASLVVAFALTGCGGASRPAQVAAPPPPPPPTAPPYDASLPPTKAVLALVPAAATTLRVVDWAEIRTQVGLPELTARSSGADRSRFWRAASAQAPLLSAGLLRQVDRQLREAYGFGQDDVRWEGHWSAGATGWALAFRPGLDMKAVRRAVRAGVGPLRGAMVRAADHLVVSDPVTGAAWANDSGWDAVARGTAEATYLGHGCAAPAREDLTPLHDFSVSFGDHVATARLGHERDDLFERMRLDRGSRAFGAVYRNGVGDPSSGRIGWIVKHPARAGRLAASGRWPFAGCGWS